MCECAVTMQFFGNNTWEINQAWQNKLIEHEWLKKPSLSQKGHVVLTWVQPLLEICHCLFLTSPTTSHPLIPYLSFFFFLLSLMFYLNSSTLLLLCTLSPSFFFPPSFLGYLLTTSLCHIYLCWSNVAGEVCLSRRWQETGDSDACLLLCLLALSEQEKLHWGFWHLKGVERVTGLHEGDVSGKTKARRESETVAVALSFLDTNRGLLGSGTT